ncbi:MAG TPA: class I SAM-dependent methyltransferase [Capsulimonadaceae bacterium]|nr:class I SAM-dependent methyltransferase [Capsulimonadaceae bacterium]
MSTKPFYDDLAPFYHLIYPDWEASIARQANDLDRMIQVHFPGSRTILDASCGIGTQALGLAKLGYQVSGSDLSPASVARAMRESEARGLAINWQVADMRTLDETWPCQFDLVIACDNAIPHLLSDDEIEVAFRALLACTKPGGGCLISVRDYTQDDKSGATRVKPYGVRQDDRARYLLWQVWEFHGDIYDVDFYFVEDDRQNCNVRVFRDRYYAIALDRLAELMQAAGFEKVERLDDRYFQPLLAGQRPF